MPRLGRMRTLIARCGGRPALTISLFSVTVAASLLVDATAPAKSEVVGRMWSDFIARPSGPLAFRFLLQPVMASIVAIHDGIKDARTGRSPYFWTVLHNPAKRKARLHEGFDATCRIIAFGILMDAIYQITVFKTFYPVEAIIIALVLAFLPYLLMRGPAERIAHWWVGRKSAHSA